MAIVKKYKVKVEKINNPLPEIFTLTFSSDKKFQYNPGQFLHLALDDYDGVGQWPESRCFSMQSNPNDELLKITIAVKGNFTNRMKNELHEGKVVWLKLPYGDIFQRGHNKSNCVFIAGGTGVTPFLSLFTSEEFSEYLNPQIYLGFRTKEHNIYGEELHRVSQRRHREPLSLNVNIIKKIFYEDKDGMLNIQTIFNENGKSGTYFISGPPVMIKNFKRYLIKEKVDPAKVITDEWE